MKRILKVASGLVAVSALACLLAAPAQARTFVSVNIGGYGGSVAYGRGGGYVGYRAYCAPPAPVCAPVYVPAPVCAPAPVVVPACYPTAYYRPAYYRPACGYYAPARYYGGGYYR